MDIEAKADRLFSSMRSNPRFARSSDDDIRRISHSWSRMMFFRDAVVGDRANARALALKDPTLLDARSLLGETALDYLAIEDYRDEVKFLITLAEELRVRSPISNWTVHECKSLGLAEMVHILMQANS